MSWWLIGGIALMTYGSRAAALVFLPRPSGRFETVLSRMPGPLFASLATLTLIGDDRSIAGGPILLAALGSLLVAPRRSLAYSLAGGLAGYALGALLL